jgi:hypothetical protein
MTNQNPRIVSPLDIIIIIFLLSGTCACLPFLLSHGPATVVVFRDNQCVARYPLSSDKVFSIRGRDGTMILSIHDNSVRVTESSCPRGICIRTGSISRRGQQIVCAPNHILVELETSSGTQVDAITQ